MIATMLAIDLFRHRDDHEPKPKEALLESISHGHGNDRLSPIGVTLRSRFLTSISTTQSRRSVHQLPTPVRDEGPTRKPRNATIGVRPADGADGRNLPRSARPSHRAPVNDRAQNARTVERCLQRRPGGLGVVAPRQRGRSHATKRSQPELSLPVDAADGWRVEHPRCRGSASATRKVANARSLALSHDVATSCRVCRRPCPRPNPWPCRACPWHFRRPDRPRLRA